MVRKTAMSAVTCSRLRESLGSCKQSIRCVNRAWCSLHSFSIFCSCFSWVAVDVGNRLISDRDLAMAAALCFLGGCVSDAADVFRLRKAGATVLWYWELEVDSAGEALPLDEGAPV